MESNRCFVPGPVYAGLEIPQRCESKSLVVIVFIVNAHYPVSYPEIKIFVQLYALNFSKPINYPNDCAVSAFHIPTISREVGVLNQGS